MDHIVYLDTQAKELDSLLLGQKTMIIRGAAGRKMPYGRVNPGDVLYFMNNNGEGLVRARGTVRSVLNSEMLSQPESIVLVSRHQDRLQLNGRQFQRWAGKRFLVLVEVEGVAALEPFPIDRSGYGNMDDWLPVGDVQQVRLGDLVR